MPRYDYLCEDCGHSFELKQSFSSEPYADCPKCQGVCRRQFHSVPIMFKGSGWYVTDYARKGSGSDGESSSESESSNSSDKKATDKKKAKTDTSKSKSSK